MGLEQLFEGVAVLNHHRNKTILSVDILEPDQAIPRKISIELPYSNVVVSRGLTDTEFAAAAARLEELDGILPYPPEDVLIGGKHYLTVHLADPSDKNRLPRVFVMQRSAAHTPRTYPLGGGTDRFLATREAIEGLGFTFAGAYSGKGREYKVIRSLVDPNAPEQQKVRFEINPLGTRDFKQFVAAVQASPSLSQLFQLYEFESRQICDTEEEAHHLLKHCIAQFNFKTWFYYDFRVVPTLQGMERPKQKWLVRALSPGRTAFFGGWAQDDLAGLFRPKEVDSWKDYLDMGQQDEQRNIDEILLRPMRPRNRRYATAGELERITKSILDSSVAIDLETTDYYKDKPGDPRKPGPSGMIVHAVLRSAAEKLVFVHKDYLPPAHPPDVHGYAIVECEDELDIVAKLNEATDRYLFITCHNGKAFDLKHLTKFNGAKPASWLEERVERYRRNYPGLSDELLEAWHADDEKTVARVNELRKVHRPEGRVWAHTDNFIDTYRYALPRLTLKGSKSMEALAGFTKSRGYDRIEEGFRTREPEELWKNLEYTARGVEGDGDGEQTWKTFTFFAPVMVWEAMISGRPLPRVALNAQYYNMTGRKRKDVLERGKHRDSHLKTRPALQEQEDSQREAIDAQRMRAFASRRNLFSEGCQLSYNPLLLHAFRSVLAAKPEFVEFANYLKSSQPLTRVLGLQFMENYLAGIIEPVIAAYDAGQAAGKPMDRDEFEQFILTFQNRSPERRLAAEHILPRSFSLHRVYRSYLRTVDELTSTGFTAQAGPFLVGDTPSRYDLYRLGTGNAWTWRGKMVAVVDGEPLLHSFRVSKDERPIAAELVAAVKNVQAPAYEPPSEKWALVQRRLIKAMGTLPSLV